MRDRIWRMKSECDAFAVAVADVDADASNRDSTCSHRTALSVLVGCSLASLVNLRDHSSMRAMDEMRGADEVII
jgi:hypothetical protein